MSRGLQGKSFKASTDISVLIPLLLRLKVKKLAYLETEENEN